MTSYWVLQASPEKYDIDRALRDLSEVRWRIPQYTGAVAPGDGVVIWRSGSESGIVGVGRVLGYPAEMMQEPDDARYAIDQEILPPETRASIAVARATLVGKDVVRSLPGWAEHLIVTAPMGTVFPISAEQWATLEPLIPELPPAPTLSLETYPPAFAWEQRSKDTYPMPGGYDSYLASLRRIVEHVASRPVGRDDLEFWMRQDLAVSESNARLGAGFLLRIGALFEHGGIVVLGDVIDRWRAGHDDALVIALLHSRVRFIGEFLEAARLAGTDSEILDVANRYFGCGWKTLAQIRRRRGWLQSAGMLTELADGRLQTTAAGVELIEHLTLEQPVERSVSASVLRDPVSQVGSTHQPSSVEYIEMVDADVLAISADVRVLIEQLLQTGNSGSQSEQFEQHTAEAFRRLGFNAEWLGKSGRTDVLLNAELGRGASYRVIVDCKSTGRTTVGNQIDWDTIDEHLELHNADYALILAPEFAGGRLPARALKRQAVLLRIDDLADLLRQHDTVPLSLDDYRLLFTADTAEDGLAAVGEIAQESARAIDLVNAILGLLASTGPKMGAMSARELLGLLLTSADLPDATETEISNILDALSAPLLRLLHKDVEGRVRFASSPDTASASLRLLARQLGKGAPG